MQVRCYTSCSALPKDISEDHGFHSLGDPFACVEWYDCLSRFGCVNASDLRLYVTEFNSNCVGGSFLLHMRSETKGDARISLANVYSLYFGLGDHLAADTVRAGLNRVISFILSEAPNLSMFEFSHLRMDKPGVPIAREIFEAAGFHVDLRHHAWNWYMQVSGRSYGEFLAGRSSRLRNTLKRKSKRAASQFHLRIETYRNADELETALADYVQIYDRSWKPSEACPDFIPQFMRLCARLGILRLAVLYLDDKPAASQFWIVSAAKAWIYKLAHDPVFDALSPGTILTAHMFERAIDVDRVREVDFGVGDEAYKRDWMEARRQLVTLQAVNPRTVRGALLAARMRARNILRGLGLRAYTPVRLEERGWQLRWWSARRLLTMPVSQSE